MGILEENVKLKKTNEIENIGNFSPDSLLDPE